MLGDHPLSTVPLSTLQIEPARTPKELRKQLQQMRNELSDGLAMRWGHVLDRAIDSMGGRGPKPLDLEAALAYMRGETGKGRPLDSKLITETAEQSLCSRKTAERAAKELRKAT